MNKLFYHILSGRYGAGFEIRILLHQTAKAFSVDAPKTKGFSAPELLESYARFTTEISEHAMQAGQNSPVLHQKLYNMAYQLGDSVHRWLRPKDEAECLKILITLYRNIGITISEENPGGFYVYSCYFSAFYTPKICSVISAIDAGIFAGIFKGGTLKFQERITDGHKKCKATFR